MSNGVVENQKHNSNQNIRRANDNQKPKIVYIIFCGFFVVVKRAIFHFGEVTTEQIHKFDHAEFQHSKGTAITCKNKQSQAKWHHAGYEKCIAKVFVDCDNASLGKSVSSPKQRQHYYRAENRGYYVT